MESGHASTYAVLVISLIGILFCLLWGGGELITYRHYRRFARRRILELLSGRDLFVQEMYERDPRMSKRPGTIWRYLKWMQDEGLVYRHPVPFPGAWRDMRPSWSISDFGRIELDRLATGLNQWVD